LQKIVKGVSFFFFFPFKINFDVGLGPVLQKQKDCDVRSNDAKGGSERGLGEML
jgi:hypothetical protein